VKSVVTRDAACCGIGQASKRYSVVEGVLGWKASSGLHGFGSVERSWSSSKAGEHGSTPGSQRAETVTGRQRYDWSRYRGGRRDPR
jgi:hypothetical protein